ncbi:hypothetical protein pb186bvf_017059 [Paramecium bursaria]
MLTSSISLQLMIMIIFLLILIVSANRLRQSCRSQLTGYYWDGQQCLQCKQPSCKCSSYQGCSDCIDHYYYDEEVAKCVRCPNGCKSCCKLSDLTQYVCTVCDDNYNNLSGVCVEMIGCETYTSNGRCQVCLDGYYRQDQCEQCPQGCNTCVSEWHCQTCDDGYYLNLMETTLADESVQINQTCQTCNTKGGGCSQCTQLKNNSLTCNNCLGGYYYYQTNYSCLKCPKLCLSCQNPLINPQVCYSCVESALLVEDQSYCQYCGDAIENCISCLSVPNGLVYRFECQTCDNGYYLEEGECKDCKEKDKNVKRCDDLNDVSQCEPGYLLIEQLYNDGAIQDLSRYVCIKNENSYGNCASCLGNLQLLKSNGKTLCVSCKQVDQQCLKCASVNNNSALTCYVCNDGYFLNTNTLKCDQCMKNCQSCQSSTVCSVCQQGYSGDTCFQCNTDNCQTCTTDQCTNCIDGYGLIYNDESNEYTCELCERGCLQCDGQQEVCTICDEQYYLQNSVCLDYPDECLQSNSDGFCYLCNTILNFNEQSEFVDEDKQYQGNATAMSIFYRAVNGYCLRCSDYLSGTFSCPQQCVDISTVFYLHYSVEIMRKYQRMCSTDKSQQRINLAKLTLYEKPKRKKDCSLIQQVLNGKNQIQTLAQRRKCYKPS